MGMDPTKGWSSLEEVTSEISETVEATVEETEESTTSKEEEDLLGREINNLSPLSSFNYFSEEEAVSKVKLLNLKIKLLKKESPSSVHEIERLTRLKKEIISKVKVLT